MVNLPFPYNGWVAGLNTTAPAYDTEDSDGSSPDLLNVNGNILGALVKRAGSYALNYHNTYAGATGLFAGAGWGGPHAPFLFAVGAASNYAVDPNDGSTSNTYGAGGLHANTLWSFVEAPIGSGTAVVLGVNGVDPPQRYQYLQPGATWAKTSGGVDVPNGRYCAYHEDQVFIAGTDNYPSGGATGPDPLSRVYWSAIKDPFNWDPQSNTGAGWMDFEPGDGKAITGLGTIGPYLLVFKPTKVWVLIDTGTGTKRQISDIIGC